MNPQTTGGKVSAGRVALRRPNGQRRIISKVKNAPALTVDDGAELDQHDAKKAKDLDDAGIAPTHKIDDLSTTVVAGALVRSVSRPSPYTARAPPSVTGLRLVSYQQLKLRGIPYSRSHLRRLEGTGQFPKHVTLGEGLGALIAWPEHEVDGWINEKMARRAPGVATAEAT